MDAKPHKIPNYYVIFNEPHETEYYHILEYVTGRQKGGNKIRVRQLFFLLLQVIPENPTLFQGNTKLQTYLRCNVSFSQYFPKNGPHSNNCRHLLNQMSRIFTRNSFPNSNFKPGIIRKVSCCSFAFFVLLESCFLGSGIVILFGYYIIQFYIQQLLLLRKQNCNENSVTVDNYEVY